MLRPMATDRWLGARWTAGLLPIAALATLTADARTEAAQGPATLDERVPVGRCVRTVTTLEARGRTIAGESTDEGADPDPMPMLEVRTRLAVVERTLAADDSGRARRTRRRVESGEVVIGGTEPIRPRTTVVRPEADDLIADLGADGDAVIACPAGPMLRDELELVQGAADPLELAALLPDAPVEAGASWPLPEAAARCLSGFDAIASNTLEGTLTRLDDREAEIGIEGRVEGAVLGGTGGMDVEGTLLFDRGAGRVARLSMTRVERREPGPVEAGLEFRSTLTVDRSDASEDAVPEAASNPERLPEGWLLLRFDDPSGRYSMEHDRSWYVVSEDERHAVLRRLGAGTVVAQCDLVLGPTMGAGARPRPERFRADVREALGDRFDRIIDAGEVGAPPEESRYRLAIAGHQGDVPIVWYYYQASDAEGRQLVAAFTLRESEVGRLGRLDQRMIDSLRWRPETAEIGAGGPSRVAAPPGP